MVTKVYECEIEEGAKIVNTRHALKESSDFYISLPSSLSFRARSSSLSASTSWVFGCSFFVDRQHINKLGRHRLN